MADTTKKPARKVDTVDEGMDHALEGAATGEAETTDKAQAALKSLILTTRTEIRAGLEAEAKGERQVGIGRQRSAHALIAAIESNQLRLTSGGVSRAITTDMVSNMWCVWSNLDQGGENTQRVDADQTLEVAKFMVETFHPVPTVGDPKKPTDKERDAMNLHRRNTAKVKRALKLAACLLYVGYASTDYVDNQGFSIEVEDFAEKGVKVVHPANNPRMAMTGKGLILCLDARKSADNPQRPECRPTVEQFLKANSGKADEGTERNTIKSLDMALDFVAENVKPDTVFTEETTKAKARRAFLALLPHFTADAAKAIKPAKRSTARKPAAKKAPAKETVAA